MNESTQNSQYFPFALRIVLHIAPASCPRPTVADWRPALQCYGGSGIHQPSLGLLVEGVYDVRDGIYDVVEGADDVAEGVEDVVEGVPVVKSP